MARLKNFLENIEDKDTKIKVGTIKGAGFFYVGTVRDFLDNCEKYEQADISYFDNRVRRANDNLETMLNADTSFSSFAKKQYRKWESTSTHPNFSMDAYNLYLRGHAIRLTKKFQTHLNEQKYRSERSPLMSRNITDKFWADRVAEPAGVMVIQIEGRETGQFWTMDEAEWPALKFNGNIEEEANE